MADTDKGSPKFKIRFDDESPLNSKDTEPPIQDEVDNLRFTKLSRKINLFAVLISCLLGLILVFGYLHISKKFDNMQVPGSSDIQSLSRDLDSKFSSLSIRQAKIEALLNEKISAMEKTAYNLEQNMEKTEKTLSGVQASRPGKEEMDGIIAEIEKKLIPLQSEIKKISSETKSLQDKFDKDSGKLATGIGDIQQEIKKIKTDSADLASSRVDKKTFDLTVRHQERFFNQKLADLEKSLSEKIESLRNQITALEAMQKKTAVTGAATKTQRPVPSAPPQVETVKPAIPQPGSIIEQEINK